MRLLIGYFLILSTQGALPALERACRAGNLQEVRNLLDNGAEITENVIITTIQLGHTSVFRELLARGSDAFFSEEVWLEATMSPETDILASLIRAGFSVDMETAGFGSALEFAILLGDYEVTRLLIGAGASVPDHLVHEIMRPCDSAIERELLEFGEALHIRHGWFNEPPLFHAILVGASGIAQQLVTESSIEALNQLSPHGRTALHAAIEHHRLDIALALLGKGVNANAVTSNGQRPLLTAVVANYADVIEPLLDHGAEIDAPQADTGATALTMSVQWRHYNIARILIARGADAAVLTPQQITELQEALA